MKPFRVVWADDPFDYTLSRHNTKKLAIVEVEKRIRNLRRAVAKGKYATAQCFAYEVRKETCVYTRGGWA